MPISSVLGVAAESSTKMIQKNTPIEKPKKQPKSNPATRNGSNEQLSGIKIGAQKMQKWPTEESKSFDKYKIMMSFLPLSLWPKPVLDNSQCCSLSTYPPARMPEHPATMKHMGSILSFSARDPLEQDK